MKSNGQRLKAITPKEEFLVTNVLQGRREGMTNSCLQRHTCKYTLHKHYEASIGSVFEMQYRT